MFFSRCEFYAGKHMRRFAPVLGAANLNIPANSQYQTAFT
jgi:hypothetical protein